MQADKDRIQQITDALTAKGIQQADYDQIRRALNELKQLQDNVASERGEQFFEDAFKATAGMGLSKDNVIVIARHMRRFAEKIASSEAVRNANANSDVANIVDHAT